MTGLRDEHALVGPGLAVVEAVPGRRGRAGLELLLCNRATDLPPSGSKVALLPGLGISVTVANAGQVRPPAMGTGW